MNPKTQHRIQASTKSLLLWLEQPIQPKRRGQTPGLSHMNPKALASNNRMNACLSNTPMHDVYMLKVLLWAQ